MPSNAKRDRGRILTPQALTKLQQAIQAWEVEHERRCTQERMKELTSAIKAGGLDPGTISKIQKGKAGVDPESIRCLFQTFGLELVEADLVAAAPFKVEVDRNFVGREGAIADLNLLVNRGARVIVIQARGGVGKTTLARRYLQQEFDTVLEFPIAKETKDIASIESLIEEKLRQLDEEPGREFLVSIDRLKRKLQSDRIGILIDNLEPALDSSGKFIEAHRRYVELLRVLADPGVRSLTLITTRERLHEPSVSVQHYPLRSLDVSAWEQFFQAQGIEMGMEAIAHLHHAYGGNAKAMDLISSIIYQDYAMNVEMYWQENQDDLLIERDLEDLVTNQFDRLEQVDADAYKLLCRLGCYRYQDVPTVPMEGVLCLLWDVPENRRKRVVKALQERSLVEFEDGEFWLHPVIRSEAIERLREGGDWERSNCEAAVFWTEDVSVIEVAEDALRAFEAYFHYTEIHDYENAGNVIAFDRYSNKSRRMQSLGGSLIRLGVWQPIISEINQIVDKMQHGYCLSNLYRILTNAYLLTGQIQNAIICSRKSGEIAQECLEEVNSNDEELFFKLGVLYRLSLMNVGLCKIFLREIEEAEGIFYALVSSQNVFGSSAKYTTSLLYEYSALAFLYSSLDRDSDAKYFVEQGYHELVNSKHWHDIWHLGYGTLFLALAYQNLGMFERAYDLYQMAINFSEQTSYFAQIKASSLTGLASIFRERKEMSRAFSCHVEAVELLEKIGAKYDLAEAYYQLGLTYQRAGEFENSYESFQKATKFFSDMQAPKQLERVRRSMDMPG